MASPQLPPGFTLDAPPDATAAPPLPPGFAIDAAPEEPPAEEDPVQDVMGKPSTLTSIINAFTSRETAVAAGGVLGSVVGGGAGFAGGLVTGPGATITGLAGATAGGALGAAGAGATYDTVSDLLATLQGRPEDLLGPQKITERAAQEGVTDAMFGMGGAMVQPARFVRAMRGWMSGVTDDAAKRMVELSNRYGIHLGAVDVGGALPRGFARTLGVFPWIGTPLRKEGTRKMLEAEKATANILDAFGPNERLASEIGVDMVAAARGAREEFRTTASALYKNVEDLIETAPRKDIIPTYVGREGGPDGGIQAYVNKALDDARAGEIYTLNREGEEVLLPRPAREEVLEFFEQLSAIPDNITVAQYRRLNEDLGDLISKRIRDGYDVKMLSDAKKALRDSFDNIQTDLLPPGLGDEVRSALLNANAFYAKGITQFQTKAAQTFERVDRFIFNAGAETPGSLNADEIYNAAINLRSPQQIRDLTQLVGVDNMRRAASTHFEAALTSSRQQVQVGSETISVVDPFQLERALGLESLAGKRNIEGMRELYKTAGVDLQDVTNLLEVMKKIEGIGNAAEFVRRRVVLGGVSTLGSAIGFGALSGAVGATAGGAATAGIIGPVAMTLLGRHFSKVFARPDRLKLMTTALDEAASVSTRRAALGRLTKALMQDEGLEVPPGLVDDTTASRARATIQGISGAPAEQGLTP
jgi:hypothetical protein